jgi:hypothetical protein
MHLLLLVLLHELGGALLLQRACQIRVTQAPPLLVLVTRSAAVNNLPHDFQAV